MSEKRGVSNVVKRDSSVVPFERQKIETAVKKSALSVGKNEDKAEQIGKEVARSVVKELEKRFVAKVPHVENVQDAVEKALMESYPDIAKSFILYRQHRHEVREMKKFYGVEDDMKLSVNAVKILEARYLLKDNEGNVIETPREMFRRVAKAVASVEKKNEREKLEKEFYEMMANQEFLPNSPTLMNAGTVLGQLSACFVIPVGDSLEEIFDAVKAMAIIQQSGGGTGFAFSRLRPKGDIVKSTKGVASGPVSFMKVFDMATEVIKQGGRRRGANMGILRADHPDIVDFVNCKAEEGKFTNFNLSVGATEGFMQAVQKNEKFEIVNPRSGKAEGKINAKSLFELIVSNAWRTGDPGIIFIDEINRKNLVPKLGRIESTNPCGEQPLLPYESCNLGSINLARMVEGKTIGWVKLKRTIRRAVRFLDNVIDANKYTLKQIENNTKRTRKIGLGVMGFAELLIKLGIPYDSEIALNTADRLMKFITKEARTVSEEIGNEKGSFPAFKQSRLANYKTMRNATVTTIAPTGTISIIAGCSSGIEPLFAVSFIRNVLEGTKMLETTSLFEEISKQRKIHSKELMMKIAENGSLQEIAGIPEDIKRIFKTALDIAPEWHVRMQAAFQQHTDNAVSKTVNLPYDATIDDIRKIYLLAHQLRCKGITIYRYGSKKEQVLYTGQALTKELGETRHVRAESDYAGGCPTTYCPF